MPHNLEAILWRWVSVWKNPPSTHIGLRYEQEIIGSQEATEIRGFICYSANLVTLATLFPFNDLLATSKMASSLPILQVQTAMQPAGTVKSHRICSLERSAGYRFQWSEGVIRKKMGGVRKSPSLQWYWPPRSPHWSKKIP